jgi:hypothetical protein
LVRSTDENTGTIKGKQGKCDRLMLCTLNNRGIGTKEVELIGELKDKKVSTAVITEIRENLKHAKQLLMIYSNVNKDNTAVSGAILMNSDKTESYVCK